MINRETVTISLPPKLLKRARKTAQETGMTQSEFFRTAVRHFLVGEDRVETPEMGGISHEKRSLKDVISKITRGNIHEATGWGAARGKEAW
jgi:metal-responsive CopG/Arc/MetJ family transcriptional regulator